MRSANRLPAALCVPKQPLRQSTTEDSALIRLFGLVATGQITLCKLDGYKQLAVVIRQRMRPPA